MKKASIILSALFLTFAFVKCKPAVEDTSSRTPAEERAKMEEQAMLTADSIAAALSASIKNGIVSSHPSAEEKAKMEEQAKLTADSIAAALSASIKNGNKTAAPADIHASH